MNVLVVGAGIGGLTTAITLDRSGHRVTLVERMDRFAPAGAGLIVAPNAARALASLGIDLASRGYALPHLDVLRPDGRILQRIEPQRLTGAYGPLWALSRASLHEALLEVLPSSVEVVLGCTVEGIRQVEDGVVVRLNVERQVDLVVGADGIHSKVREAACGPRPLRYSGVTCWRGLVPNPGYGHAFEVWGGEARVGVVPLRDDRLYYFLVHSAPRRAPAPEWPDGFERLFGHLRPVVGDLLDALEEAPPLHHDLEELDRPAWGTPRALLLGDAAHAITPNQGQGAAMAIEDALALDQALAGGLEGALARYVALRHRRVRRIQLDSRRLGRLAHWHNPVARAFRDGLMRLLPTSVGDAQYRRVVEPGLALVQSAGAPAS
jgi:2-heptyl-3-hydroxy-4(1H)-quinolone synthase